MAKEPDLLVVASQTPRFLCLPLTYFRSILEGKQDLVCKLDTARVYIFIDTPTYCNCLNTEYEGEFGIDPTDSVFGLGKH